MRYTIEKHRQYFMKEVTEPELLQQKKEERGAIVSVLQKKPEVIVFAGPNGSGIG